MKEIITLKRETLDAFLNEKRQEGIAEQQVKTIQRHVEQFYDWLPEGKELNADLLTAWRTDLEEHMAAGTAAHYATHVKELLRFAGYGELSRPRRKRTDLTGQRFGRLVAVAPTDKKQGKSRSVVWLCRCDCGQMTEATQNALQQGTRVSCGCQQREKLQDYKLFVDNTSLQQVFSDTVYTNNTSGCRGVYQSRGQWAAEITYKHKRYFLGRYEKQDDAIRARREAEAWVRDDALELLERLMSDEVQRAI